MDYFFHIYKELEGKFADTYGWSDRVDAYRIIEEAAAFNNIIGISVCTNELAIQNTFDTIIIMLNYNYVFLVTQTLESDNFREIVFKPISPRVSS